MTTPRSDSELEQLYHRVIADPHSATRAEYNIVWQWPPPEEKDRLCVEKTGLTRAGLVAKALAAPDELTRDEAQIVYHPQGVNFATRISAAELLRRRKERTPLDALRNEATGRVRAAASAGEKAARMNALDRITALRRAETEKIMRDWDEYEAARRLTAGSPWAKAMLRNGLLDGGASWGFVVFRTGSYGGGPGLAADEAWTRFRGYFDSVAETMILHFNSGPLLWPKFRAVFVEREELEGASDEQLREEFRRMKRRATGVGAGAQDSELPNGMRTSCFLVADRSAIECEAVTTGFIVRHDNVRAPSVNIPPEAPVAYVRAVDPDFGEGRGPRGGEVIETTQGAAAAGKEDAMAGFPGAVKVALPRVFDWLHFVCFHAERAAAWDGHPRAHGWPEIYEQTKDPEAWVRDFAANTGGINYTGHSYVISQRMQS